MQRLSAKDHGSPKCPSVVPFEILQSEVANFEHFGLERHFNMAAMIVFTPKNIIPSEGDISRLEPVFIQSVCVCAHLANKADSDSEIVIRY